MNSNPDVLIDLSGGIGRITLNRPDSLNALTRHMSREISEALTRWRDDDSVLLRQGERAFSPAATFDTSTTRCWPPILGP